MTRHRLYRDDALVYDFTEGSAPTPPGPTTPPTPTPPPSSAGDIVNPGQNAYAFASPGEVLSYHLLTSFQGENISGGQVQFANQPPYTTLSTMYEASISQAAGDFTNPVDLGSAGGSISWYPPDIIPTPSYGVVVVPRGERWYLNFRVKPDAVGQCALGPNGQCGLTYYWSVLSN